MSQPNNKPNFYGSFSSAQPKPLEERMASIGQYAATHQKQSLLFPGSESKNTVLSKQDERHVLTMTLSDKIKRKLKIDNNLYKQKSSKNDRLNFEQAKRQF